MEVTPEASESPAKVGLDHAVEAHGTHHEAHKQAHHEEDPSNPHYFGLPIGVIIAGLISATAVTITLVKFFWFS